MIRLVTPSEVNEIEYKELVNEFTAAGEDLVPNALEKGKLSFNDHIKNLEDYSIGMNLPENYVPASTYFLIDHIGNFIGLGFEICKNTKSRELLAHAGLRR